MASDSIIHKQLDAFFLSGARLSFKKGTVILMPADTVDSVYVIEKGFVKVYWLTEDGNEKMHVIYKAGEMFPLMWALNDEQVGGYYVAMDEVVCRRVATDDLQAFVKTHPEVVFPLIEKLSQIFRIYVSQVDNLVITRSYPRLVARLLFLAKRFGREEQGGIVIDAPITNTDIANSIALTRETVNREIQLLKKRKLIGNKGRKLVLYDREQLKQELLANS